MPQARILVIEDDDSIRDYLCRILEKAGHQVIGAENGKQGIVLYREHNSDLVITDIIMPEMEGIETILNIRSDCPEAKIIAISGGGNKMSIATCLATGEIAGAVKTIPKPFNEMTS